MPTVKLSVADVAVELTANEASTAELAKQALELYRDAVNSPRPPAAAIGFAKTEETPA